jgi:two-component system phosphate regulon response regulator PhoB
MPKQLVFVIEDEEDILELISYNLSKEGYQIQGFTSGEEALRQLRAGRADCVVLDLMLPGMDGLEVCKAIRGAPETRDVPLNMLTAKGEEADIVTGLEMGVDDYIVKPFSPRILAARLKAVLRRKRQGTAGEERVLKVHSIEIHPGRHEVRVDGKLVSLTSSEFSALHFLAGRPGWVFTRYQIVEAIHGINYPVTDRSVDVLIVGLRKKLGAHGKLIETVRGIGYRFKEAGGEDWDD